MTTNDFDADEWIDGRVKNKTSQDRQSISYKDPVDDSHCPNPKHTISAWHGMAIGDCKGSWAYQYGGEPLPDEPEPEPVKTVEPYLTQRTYRWPKGYGL